MLEEALRADETARRDVSLYEELGGLLRAEDPKAAVELYCSFPFSDSADFDELGFAVSPNARAHKAELTEMAALLQGKLAHLSSVAEESEHAMLVADDVGMIVYIVRAFAMLDASGVIERYEPK